MELALKTLDLRLSVACHSRLGPAWSLAGQVDSFSRIYLVESGAGFVHHHDRRFILRPGRIYLIPARSQVWLGCDRAIEIKWAHFDAFVLSGMSFYDYFPCRYESAPRRIGFLRQALERLIEIHDGGAQAPALEIKGCLSLLLSEFTVRGGARAADKNVARLTPALEYVAANLGERISVPALAALVHLEPTYFSTLFGRTFGEPPVRYVTRKRIERAQEYLRRTDWTIERIAGALGFSDAFHLSKAFKSMTGEPPSDFRKRAPGLVP